MTTLLWRAHYWNEATGTMTTTDNTQSAAVDLPGTHMIGINQLTDGGADSDRLFGYSRYFCITRADGLDRWAGGDPQDEMDRQAKGTVFVGIRGIQIYFPDYESVLAQMRTDPEFPNATIRDSMDAREQAVLDTAIQREKKNYNDAKDLMDIERQKYIDLQAELGGGAP